MFEAEAMAVALRIRGVFAGPSATVDPASRTAAPGRWAAGAPRCCFSARCYWWWPVAVPRPLTALRRGRCVAGFGFGPALPRRVPDGEPEWRRRMRAGGSISAIYIVSYLAFSIPR